MEKRRGAYPGHQGGISHRVPEPPTAPSERVVRPIGAHRDTERQKYPREQRPRPYPARPSGIDAPVDQRGNRAGNRDRKSDIADIEQRRMHGESWILPAGTEAATLERPLGDAQEWIRRDHE